ncbi:MAG: adenylate/guanylate cyclase domain-containing protein [Candidatus Bathyarchaeia archaeon]
MSEGQRRLAAIMFTDLVGYTALTQRNEALAMQLLEEHRRLVRPFFPKHSGREVKTIGDAFLVEFASALEATRCAFDIQQSLSELNSVIHDQNDVYGDAVNIASRIEPLASPGGICVSQQVYDQIKNKFEFPLSTLGEKTLKNVSEPVEVYRVILPWEKKSESESELEKTRIAVLPFTNMSSNPEEGYFADGMTEELITSLSGVRQLTVIARTSVMGYKGTTKKVREIGRELEVGSVLEGSVRKAGSKVRITAQLIDATTEGHLWAQNYDRQLEDVFAIQSEIAEKVAGELRIRLVDSEKRTLEKKPTENTEAYTCFLRGRELFREETEASLKQALGLFEKAIELDPRFARAHVGVAECHQSLAGLGFEQFDVSLSTVKSLLERAIDLDPNLPEAHAVLAEMFFNVDDMPGLDAEARRALELNPSLPQPYSMLSELAAMNGDPGEMVRQTETAYRLDPIRPRFIYSVGTAYLWTGREEEALELWKKTEQLAPAYTYRGMTEYYIIKGDLEKAKEFHAKAEKLEPTNPRIISMGGIIAAMEGDKEKALLAIKKIEDAKIGPLGFNYIGYIYHALGDLDSYFEYMNKAREAHQIIPSTMMYSPLFARARADPRYLELVERLRKQCGLTE